MSNMKADLTYIKLCMPEKILNDNPDQQSQHCKSTVNIGRTLHKFYMC